METEDFTPGEVTDTCGICFARFDLQYHPSQYSTVEAGNGEWMLIGDCCANKVAA